MTSVAGSLGCGGVLQCRGAACTGRGLCLQVLRALKRLAGMALVGMVSVHGQIPEAPIRGFTLPLVDRETLELKARVRGEVATPLGPERMEIQGVRLESFGGVNRTNLVITTERCHLLVDQRRLESPEALRVVTGDGRLRLAGEGFSWDATGGLVVSNRVDAELQRPRAERDAAQGMQQNGSGAEEVEVLRIRSTQFRYHEGEAVFAGRVRVTEGADQLNCDRLRLGFRMESGELAPSPEEGAVSDLVDRIEADGAVEVLATNFVLRADRAVYDLEAGTVKITGGARWRSGERDGEAEEVWLDRLRDRLWAQGGVRVRLPFGGDFGLPAGVEDVGGGAEAGPLVEVRARTLEIEPDPLQSGLSRAVFRDEVEVTQGASGGLTCQLLQARYGDLGSEQAEGTEARGPVLEGVGALVEVVDARAEGGVRLWRGTNEVEGLAAVYTAASGVVDVAGPVAWLLEGRVGRSDRLRLHAVERLTEALGGVQMQLPAGSLRSVDQVLAPGLAGVDGSVPGLEPEPGAAAGEPVEIRCQDFRFREAGLGRAMGLADFTGGVEVRSGEAFRLQCGRMLAEIPPGTNAIHRLVAAEQVEIRAQDAHGTRVARGDRAEYLGTEDMLWLTGEGGVEMELEDRQGTHRGRGRLAVYDGNRGVLELRSEAVLDSAHGRLTGEVVRVDRVQHVLAAGGGWRLRFPVGGLRTEEAGDAGGKVVPWP